MTKRINKAKEWRLNKDLHFTVLDAYGDQRGQPFNKMQSYENAKEHRDHLIKMTGMQTFYLCKVILDDLSEDSK